MTKFLLRCKDCNRYGLLNVDSKCKHCGGQLINPKPPKYSLTDKYAQYRMVYFKEEFKKRFE
jgi:rRNA maturation protein Nop10